MYEEHTVGVVVPAYNEAGLVGTVIETVPSFVDRVYVIDDCSTDGTWEEIQSHANRPAMTLSQADTRTAIHSDADSIELEEIGGAVADGGVTERSVADTIPVGSAGDGTYESEPAVIPIRHAENRGIGGALKTGYRCAIEDEIDVTAVLAGDGQMDPDYLEHVLDPVVSGEAEYAKGNRLNGSEYYTDMSAWRLFGNFTLTLLTKVSSGYWEMMDPQNGYSAISLEALERIDLDDLYDGYGFLNDLLVALNAEKCRIADVSMPAVYGDEESHIEYHSFVPTLSWLLLRRFVRRLGSRYLLRDFHPLSFMYAVGVAGAGVAVAGLGTALRSKEDDASGPVQLLAATALFVVSSLCILLGMTFDREENDDLVVRIR